jgi:hypothetical protein
VFSIVTDAKERLRCSRACGCRKLRFAPCCCENMSFVDTQEPARKTWHRPAGSANHYGQARGGHSAPARVSFHGSARRRVGAEYWALPANQTIQKGGQELGTHSPSPSPSLLRQRFHGSSHVCPRAAFPQLFHKGRVTSTQDQRAVGRPARAGSGQRASSSTSSARCRSLRPPTVFAWAIRQRASARSALVGPIRGTTRSSSRTFAVSTQVGGSATTRASLMRPAATPRFSCARATRTSFAFASARKRCSGDRPKAVGVRPTTDTVPILR